MNEAVESPDDLVTVRLLKRPLQVHARARQHSEAVRREFALIVEHSREHPDAVPTRLLELSAVLSGRYEGFTTEQEELLEDRIDAGDLQLEELTFRLPAHAGEGAKQLGAVLGEADAFCRDGQLLTLETPPDLVTYRNWYLSCFISQCAGGDPVPWSGPLA